MMNDKNVEKIVKLTLIRLGVKCDLIGFTYLAKSILIAIERPLLVYNLKTLFKEVAESCGVTNPFRIEANIQNAINSTYKYKGWTSFNDLYGVEVFKPNYKPTTAEVIMLIAEYYKLGMYEEAV